MFIYSRKAWRWCVALIALGSVLFGLTGCLFHGTPNLGKETRELDKALSKLVPAFDDRDAEAVKAMFSETVRGKVDLDEGIEYIFSILKGRIQNTEDNSNHSSEGINADGRTSSQDCRVKVFTDEAEYILLFHLITQDTAHRENEGISSMQLYLADDKAAAEHEDWGLGNLGPNGIYIPQNVSRVLAAIEAKDAEKLKSMFSQDARDSAADLDREIKSLFDSFTGYVLSYESAGYDKSWLEYSDGDIEYYQQRFTIKTTSGKWFLYLARYTTYGRNMELIPEKIGIDKIQLIKADDTEALFNWGENFKTGIYMPGVNDIGGEKPKAKKPGEDAVEKIIEYINKKDEKALVALISPNIAENVKDLEQGCSYVFGLFSNDVDSYELCVYGHYGQYWNVGFSKMLYLIHSGSESYYLFYEIVLGGEREDIRINALRVSPMEGYFDNENKYGDSSFIGGIYYPGILKN